MRIPHTVSQNRRALRIIRTLTVLLIAAVSIAVNLGSSYGAVSITTDSDVGLQGVGDQTDPHSDCDRVTYLNDDSFGFPSIHYFDIATNTDHVVPGHGANIHPDIYDGPIAFTEPDISGPVVVLLVTTTQTRTVVSGFNNSRSRLGGNLVVFENRSFTPVPNQSEISIYDRSSGSVCRLTDLGCQ